MRRVGNISRSPLRIQAVLGCVLRPCIHREASTVGIKLKQLVLDAANVIEVLVVALGSRWRHFAWVDLAVVKFIQYVVHLLILQKYVDVTFAESNKGLGVPD